MPKNWTKTMVAKLIDHTLLKATATAAQIRELCAEARLYSFATVCVNPRWVALAFQELTGSTVLVCSVVGFPLGANQSGIKAEEARQAVKQGAREIDMVIDLGALKTGDWQAVEEDIQQVVKAVGKIPVKVIIETCYLSDDEKRRACEAVITAGASFVKSSTGYGSGGATSDDIRLLKKQAANRCLVKAAGGIRSHYDAIQLLEAGADRIGTSSAVAIIAKLPD